jgi:hypothetical protein
MRVPNCAACVNRVSDFGVIQLAPITSFLYDKCQLSISSHQINLQLIFFWGDNVTSEPA